MDLIIDVFVLENFLVRRVLVSSHDRLVEPQLLHMIESFIERILCLALIEKGAPRVLGRLVRGHVLVYHVVARVVRSVLGLAITHKTARRLLRQLRVHLLLAVAGPVVRGARAYQQLRLLPALRMAGLGDHTIFQGHSYCSIRIQILFHHLHLNVLISSDGTPLLLISAQLLRSDGRVLVKGCVLVELRQLIYVCGRLIRVLLRVVPAFRRHLHIEFPFGGHAQFAVAIADPVRLRRRQVDILIKCIC